MSDLFEDGIMTFSLWYGTANNPEGWRMATGQRFLTYWHARAEADKLIKHNTDMSRGIAVSMLLPDDHRAYCVGFVTSPKSKFPTKPNPR